MKQYMKLSFVVFTLVNLLAICGLNGMTNTVKNNGEIELKGMLGFGCRVTAAAFSPDDKKMIVGLENNAAVIIDLNLGKNLFTLRHETLFYSLLTGYKGLLNAIKFGGFKLPIVTSVAFGAEYAVTGSQDKTAKIWDSSSGKCTKTLNGHKDDINSVAISFDDQLVATGSSDNTVKIWDVGSGNCFATLKEHDNIVTSVAFSPNGKQVISGSFDGTAKIWDVDPKSRNYGTCLITLDVGGMIQSVAFSKNGASVVAGSYGKARVWDVKSGKETFALQDEGYAASVEFSHNGRWIITGSSEETVKIWDVVTGKCLITLMPDISLFGYDVAFASDSKHFVVAGKYDNKAMILSMEKYLRNLQIPSLKEVYKKEDNCACDIKFNYL